MNAIILSIGDELVLGQTIDTNSAWLSQQLAGVGCAVSAHMTVGDDQAAIEGVIKDSAQCCNFLVITGGIGPTADDLTRQALAAVMNVPLELNETWLAKLEDFFAARGRPMPEMNRIQAMIPRGAEMIENTCGTAAGIRARLRPTHPYANVPLSGLQGRQLGRILTKVGKITRDQLVEALTLQKHRRQFGWLGQILIDLRYISPADRDAALAFQKGELPLGFSEHPLFPGLVHSYSCEVFVMPGVPKEMKAMFTRDVLPVIQSSGGGAVILSRTLHTFGLGESAIAEMLGGLMDRSRNPSVGTTVSQGIVSLRINARYSSKEEAQRQLDETEAACRAALGDLVFGADEETLPTVIARMLRDAKLRVTTAESCTGGLLAKMLTDVPGSSTYFTHGWITYANDAKVELLGVDPGWIKGHGAVSTPVVRQMAQGALRRAKADIALAISGVAGPDGGTPEKPVGTVHIGIAFKRALTLPSPGVSGEGPDDGGTDDPAIEAHGRRFNLFGDREMIRDRAAKMALTMLRYHLLGKPLPF